MTTQTAQTIIGTIGNTNFDSLYRESFEDADFRFEGNEENGFESDDTEYAVMFNVETESLFFLNYATKDNGWARTAASQNPWVVVGYVSALAIVAGLEQDYLIARMQDVIISND
jgi:hypothetical protein